MTYAARSADPITRCKTCGTPVPAEEDTGNVYLIAGMLDDPLGAAIRHHIVCGARADWERDAHDVRYFLERSSGPKTANAP